jgi:YbgC/YbaW family acyl-CoA thioester hydrolase
MSTDLHAKFETGMQVRPDDIDMFNHVHSSRYMDYVLAARYEQMARCYRMSWADFIARGFGWFLVSTHMNFKRPLGLGDSFVVRTWVDSFRKDGVKVGFEIDRKDTGKRCFDGWADYTLITLATGRATLIPDDIKARYTIAPTASPVAQIGNTAGSPTSQQESP